jgi:hypothetical protein
VVEKVAPPDQRKFAVLPIAAALDPELHGFSMKVLAVLCSYCNRAGITWVGQQRIADHLGVAKQQVARAMKQLRDRGHVEIVSKGFRGERANTTRVIFAADISTEDAIAVTSSQEDTRPPEIKRREAKAMTEKEEDFTEEQMAANRARLKEMLGGLAGRDGTMHYNKPETIGDIMARKPRAKVALKAVDKPVDNVSTKPYIDNIIDNMGVVRTRKNIGYGETIRVYEYIIKKKFNNSVRTTEVDLKLVALLCELGMDDDRYLAALDALTKPESMAVVCDRVINA